MESPFQKDKPGIKPFTAVDLAPQRADGHAGAAPGPGVSPFLEGFQSPFQPKEDFSPVPLAAPPAAPAQPSASGAARASAILSTVDFPAAGSDSAFKPRFFLSTTAAVDGHPIETYLGLVSAEIVVPKDVLFRNPAPYGELHRLKAAEEQLLKVKEKALEEIAEKARQLGADGVVGMRLDYSALDAVACLCCVSGTAVKLAP